MKRKRVSTDQIVRILNEAQLRYLRADFLQLANKYGDMYINDARKLRAPEVENQQLKRLVADLSLDNQILKDLLEKNSSCPKRSEVP